MDYWAIRYGPKVTPSSSSEKENEIVGRWDCTRKKNQRAPQVQPAWVTADRNKNIKIWQIRYPNYDLFHLFPNYARYTRYPCER
jgi:hypothetical protein